MLTEEGTAARLVPRADAAGLADGLASLLADADLRLSLGRAAREAVASYRADLVIDQWEQVIADALR